VPADQTPQETVPAASAGLDVSVPNSARIWNYWLGGKDNFAIDRAVGEQVKSMFPGIAVVARVQREFRVRAVSYLAGEAGIRQFLDIGPGLPTADSTHQVAQRIAPTSRVVYADIDPVVLTHARALLTSHPDGATAFVAADLREPGSSLLLPRRWTSASRRPSCCSASSGISRATRRPARSWRNCWPRWHRAATW
jgi:hypothetical protein